MTLRPEDWPRVKHVFDGAVLLDPGEWSAFLSRACAQDAALRRQVEALLAAHARAAGFLESPASTVLDIVSASDDGANAKIGPYQISRVLGRGGMGVVYAGIHEATGTHAAVKTAAAPRAEKLLLMRREIEALARLRHPGVVRILDFGVERGRPWYAMELLDHPTLAEQATALPRDEKLGLVQRLCETLAYVHGEGIVHGDLKPRNILIDRRGVPVLVDFGLVAHVSLATGRDVLDDARIAGSIRYMAPEQISGDLLDPRTDLYALGCILYELLTGQPLFDGDLEAMIEQHRNRPPRAPSELVDNVPPGLDALVLRLLAKRPVDRIAYAIDVASALSHLGAASLPPYADAPSARSYLCRAPLVGRETALDQIDVILSNAGRGAGAVVLIRGESGVGKTRLALEVARRALARGHSVITGAATAVGAEHAGAEGSGGPPLHPLVPLLQAIGDRCTEGGVDAAERLLGDRGPVLAAYEPALLQVLSQQDRPAPLVLPAPQAQLRLFRCLAESVAAYAASAPVVVVLDDLQWSDELTLGFVDYLARGPVATLRLVLIGTYRSEEHTGALAAMAQLPAATSIALLPVSTDEVGRMVGGMLSLVDPPREFVTFLAETSEGNPYFVTEYLRVAVSEGVLVRNAVGQLVFSEAAGSADAIRKLPLPHSLREVIDRRVRNLSPLARRAVRCATVMGREFDAATLQAAEGFEDIEIGHAIGELVDRHVVELTDGGRCRFTHDKLREIPYSDLPDDARRAMHGRVAAAMERRCLDSGDAEWMHASLGRHWAAGGESARAIPHLHRAGDQAAALHAVRDAIALYREAVVNIERLGASAESNSLLDERAIREKLADALTLGGAHADAQVQLERALAASDPDETVDRARRQCKIGRTLENRRDFEGALAAYAKADGMLGPAGPDRPLPWLREWVQVQLRRAWVWYWKDEPGEIDALIANVGPYIHQPGIALERSLYYQALLTRDFRRHRYVISEENVDHARAALAAAQEAGGAVDAVFPRFALGFALLFQGRLEEADTELGAALKAARSVGDIASEVRCLAYLVITSRRAQHVDRTRARAEATISAGQAAGMSDYAAVGQAGLGWVAWRLGDRREARTQSQTAVRSWSQSPIQFPFQWIARLTLLASDLDRAPVDDLVALIEPLLDPGQALLPETIDAALHDAVTRHRRDDVEATREALSRLSAAALELGFL